MIDFNFRVNKSFQKPPRHPITIPKAIYERLEKENLDEVDNLAVVCPDGTRMAGWIYFYQGTRGRPAYYQIELRGGYQGDPLNKLRIGQRLKVEIERTNNGVVLKLGLI